MTIKKTHTLAELREVIATYEAGEIRMRAEWHASDQSQKQQIAGLQKTLTELHDEANALRDKLMTAYLDNERMRGYLDGQADAQPPRMVPEEREAKGPYRNRPWNEDTLSGPGFGSPKGKAWYHK